MSRARRYQRLLAVSAFGLLALAAEVVGRSLTHRFDPGRHVATPSYADAAYYPFLLAGVKIGVALLLARLLWRVLRARAAERAARRVLTAVGHPPPKRAPRVRLSLSPRLWLLFFASTSLIYLFETDVHHAAYGRLGPWLHSSALPVFAVLAVVCAFVWGVVRRWLADYEEYAHEAVARALRLAAASPPPMVLAARPRRVDRPPRRLFGLSFESRPPPLVA